MIFIHCNTERHREVTELHREKLELKSVEELNLVHEAQILTYMKFAEKKIGLLINFNVTLLKNGLRRYVR